MEAAQNDNLPRSGVPCKTSPCVVKSCSACKVTLLKKAHVQARLKLPMNTWMIQRMLGWRWCGQMKPKSSSLVSILPAVFGERWILTMSPRTPSPPSSREGGALCFRGVSLLRAQVDFNASRDRWMGPCTVKSWHPPSLSQDTKNGLWMGLPARQWLKTYSKGNKWVSQEEAH